MRDAQIKEFQTDGFTAIPQLIEADLVEELRGTYDAILCGEIDCGTDVLALGIETRQVMHPSRYIPALADSPAIKLARLAATELLQTEEVYFGDDMLIYKPPGDPNATPWHQDLSYSTQPAGSPNKRGQVTFWIALDDVDEENGCMHFVPGRDGVLLEHVPAIEQGAAGGRFLEVKDVANNLDVTRAVPCPIRAGGATVHNEGTPHYTPPNRSATRARRAYIPTFFTPNNKAYDRSGIGG